MTAALTDLVGTDQALDGEILAALSANFKGLDAWLAGLDVRGAVDFHCTARDGNVKILFHPRLDAVASPRIPFPVSRVDGEVTFSSATGIFGFRNMVFRLGKGIVDIAKGAVSPGRSGTTVTVKGSAQGLRLEEEIGPLLGPEGFGKWRLEGVGGMADVEDADLSIALGPRREVESVKGRAVVFFERAGMTGPVRIQNLNGEVSLTSRKPASKECFLDLSGTARDLFFRLEGKDLTNVSFDFDAGDEALRIRSLDGYLYGGRITGGKNAFRLAFASPSFFKGSVSVAGTDLNRLVGKGGYAFRDIHGRLDWKSRFDGEMENIHKIKAEGRVDQAATRLSRARIVLDGDKRDLAETTVRAGFDGTLSSVSLVEGGLVSPNEKLAELIDPTSLEVAFRVSTAQYVRLLDGAGDLVQAPVVARLNVTGTDLSAVGRISRDSAATGEGQSGRVLFARLGAAPALKPGDFVTVTIEEPPLDDVVRLAASALDSAGTVLVLGQDGRLESLDVELLRRQGDDVLVRGAGLAGREVVNGRTPLLGAGIRVRPLRDEVSVVPDAALLDLSDERRARLVAFVEASHRMPDDEKAQTLSKLSEGKVPARLVHRIESRMGG